MKSKKTIVEGYFATAVGSYSGKFLEFVNQALIGRLFGPELFGIYKLSIAVLMLGSMFGMFGFRSAIPRFTANYLGIGDSEKSKGVFVFSFLFLLPASVVVGCVIYFGADIISHRLFSKESLSPLLKTVAFIIPFIVCHEITTCYLRGRKEFGLASFYYNMTVRLLFLIAIVFLLIRGEASIQTILSGLGLAYLLTFLLSFAQIIKNRLPRVQADLKQSSMLRYSWPLVFTTALNQTEKRIDLYALAYFLPSRMLGWYSACYFLIKLLVFPVVTLGNVLLPVFSELFAKNDKEQLIDVYTSIINWVTVIGIALFIIILFSSELLISSIFGKEYLFPQLKTVVLLLSIGFLTNQLTGPKIIFLQAIGKTKIIFYMGISFGIITLVLTIIFVAKFGIVGAAASTTVSLSMYAFGGLYYVKQHISINVINKRFVKILFSGLCAGLIAYTVGSILGIQLATSSVLGLIVTFLIVYVIMLYFLRPFIDDDIFLFKKAMRKINGKLFSYQAK
jgi:O-antigen/teichoic acid export membrane protein